MKLHGLLIILSLLAGPVQAFAQSADFYCGERELGENFYCEPPEVIEEAPEPEVMGPPPAPSSAPQDFDVFKEELNKARSKAVWTGEKEDIREYMVLQKQAGEMSSKFMSNYQILGWQNPDLSYVVKSPANTLGKRAYRGERRVEVERHVSKLNDRYGLYYFYSKNCPACTTFSPIVKMFSARHEISVMPVAKRGESSPAWPGTKVENGIAERLGLYGNVTPAIILFDAQEKVGVPISYGVVSLEDLENRIYVLTKDTPVKFVGGDNDAL